MRDLVPPQDLDTEKALLGSLVLANEMFDDVAAIGLTPGRFYHPSHQAIAAEVWAMRQAGQPVDAVTLAAALRARGRYDEVGGDVYLDRVIGCAAIPANAVEYARTVLDLAVKRSLIEAAHRIQKDAYDPRAEADLLVERAEGLIFGLSEDRSAAGATAVGSHIDAVMERYAARRQRQALGMGTGFVDLDAIVTIEPGQLIVVAGRPSMGKTALAMNVVEHVTLGTGQPALVISLEMSAVELTERLLVSRARIDGSTIRRGINLRPEEEERWNRAAGEVFGASIQIDASLSNTAAKVGSLARRQKRQTGLGLLMVDYLQLMEGGSDAREARHEQIAVITRRFKTMAREMGIPVMLLSQLNRASESREDKRPRMSDLRESGAIEQDADHIWLIHRPDAYDPTDQPGVAELIVAKNRNGPTDTIKLAFLKNQVRFENYAPLQDSPPEAPY